MVIEAEATLERLSKSEIGDLALDAAVQLQRAKSGGDLDATPLHELAAALRHSAGDDEGFASVSQMWPGYLDPFERLYRSANSAEPKSFKQLRDFIGTAISEIDAVGGGRPLDGGIASRLMDFCLQLNLELGRRQWLETRSDESRRRDPIEAGLR